MHTTRLAGDGCAVLSLHVHQHVEFVACRRARAFDGAAGWQVALWSLAMLGSWPIVHLSTWEHRRMPLEAHHCPLLRAWRVGVGVGWPRPLRLIEHASSACVCARRGVMVVVVGVCGRRVRAVRWRRAVSQCFLLPACCGQSRGRQTPGLGNGRHYTFRVLIKGLRDRYDALDAAAALFDRSAQAALTLA